MVRTKEPASYPLEAVLRQRELERKERTRDVRSAESEASVRALELERAEHAVRGIREEIETDRQNRLACVRDGARAHDIQSSLAYAGALQQRLDEALSNRDKARRLLDESQRRLETARENLAKALVELRAVERHRDHWMDERRREAELKAEEDP